MLDPIQHAAYLAGVKIPKTHIMESSTHKISYNKNDKVTTPLGAGIVVGSLDYQGVLMIQVKVLGSYNAIFGFPEHSLKNPTTPKNQTAVNEDDGVTTSDSTTVSASNIATLASSTTKNDKTKKVVPTEIIKALEDSIKTLVDGIEDTVITDTSKGTVELTSLNVLKTILTFLKKNTEEDVKLAVIYFTSCMNVYQQYVPSVVFDFLVSTNDNSSLRDYINIIKTQ